MNMIAMVAILLAIYFTSLVIMLFYHKQMNPRLWNLIFCILITGFLVAYYIYQYRHGTFKKFMTFDYISPFTFTTIPLMYIMNKKTKEFYLSMIAFLSFGMFGALFINPQQAYLLSFKQEATLLYAFDALSHLFCSLFGIYLVLSGQVAPTIKNWCKSMLCLYGVITTAIIINVVFHTNYFYMSPYGNYKIYFLDLFPTFWATCLAFYLGIFIVLVTGFQIARVLHNIFNEQKQTA